MRIALTGATGFLGRYVAAHLLEQGHTLRCWCRPNSDNKGLMAQQGAIEWMKGDLGDRDGMQRLVEGCDGVVHAALFHPSGSFRGAEGNHYEDLHKNLMGSIFLIEEAHRAGCGRFVFVSTCAVHEKILGDRPLDEAHPAWPGSHYGAYKAAVEAFVHSYGKGHGFPVCAVRPTGIYGVAHPVQNSRWYELVSSVARGETVTCQRGGKEVHAADVARAIGLLLTVDGVTGEVFNCYDRYISEYEVATLARRLSGSNATVEGGATTPKNQIVTDKIRALGMTFGGDALLERTVGEMVRAVRD